MSFPVPGGDFTAEFTDWRLETTNGWTKWDNFLDCVAIDKRGKIVTFVARYAYKRLCIQNRASSITFFIHVGWAPHFVGPKP
jgi:hypothetical protein